jgi:3-hydroxy-D-aspartate aldolase
MNYNPAPAKIGDTLEEIDTPALIIDLDVFDSNVDRMANRLYGSKSRLRPHSKSHKCPSIARRQLDAGAIGVCCQKISEAEVMVEGGIRNVLISNQVVGQKKCDRIAALSKLAEIAVCSDSLLNVEELANASLRFNTEINVLVEIDVGTHRCGVLPGDEALALAKLIEKTEGLHFSGLQAYQGRAQHMRTIEERRKAFEIVEDAVRMTVELLKENGLTCQIIGGGGTGTFELEAASGLFNEIQAGSYIFMDADYGRNLDSEGLPVSEFGQSLFVLATVMSTAVRGQIVVDAGLKAFSVDSGLPLLADFSDLEFTRASDEHGIIQLQETGLEPSLGQKIRIVPGHCDPTVNLHSWIVGVRGGVVECLWPVSAQGANF